jgi:hypothetical protein
MLRHTGTAVHRLGRAGVHATAAVGQALKAKQSHVHGASAVHIAVFPFVSQALFKTKYTALCICYRSLLNLKQAAALEQKPQNPGTYLTQDNIPYDMNIREEHRLPSATGQGPCQPLLF